MQCAHRPVTLWESVDTPTRSPPRLPLGNSLNGSLGDGVLFPPPLQVNIIFQIYFYGCYVHVEVRGQSQGLSLAWDLPNRQQARLADQRGPRDPLVSTFPVLRLHDCAVINLRSFYVGSINRTQVFVLVRQAAS